jgi:tRNA wybutosine-synthesizing protein 3
MPQNIFLQRKKAVLSKSDKSSKGSWDRKITNLCSLINSKSNYYTTSSCSGRIVIMLDNTQKSSGLFLKTYHNQITFEQLKKDLDEILTYYQTNKKSSNYQPTKPLIKNLSIKFKQEPCILHIDCKTLEDTNHIIKIARKTGFKKIGIITLDKRFVVEITGSHKLEFPLINSGKLLVNQTFLKQITEISNKNLEKSWNLIDKLENLI